MEECIKESREVGKRRIATEKTTRKKKANFCPFSSTNGIFFLATW